MIHPWEGVHLNISVSVIIRHHLIRALVMILRHYIRERHVVANLRQQFPVAARKHNARSSTSLTIRTLLCVVPTIQSISSHTLILICSSQNVTICMHAIYLNVVQNCIIIVEVHLKLA